MLIAPAAHAVLELAPSQQPTTIHSRQIVGTHGTPLLDLTPGETAVIRTPLSSTEVTSPPPDYGAVAPTGYELRRLDQIADTRSASVFTGRHSALPENIVAKAIRYESGTATELMRYAR